MMGTLSSFRSNSKEPCLWYSSDKVQTVPVTSSTTGAMADQKDGVDKASKEGDKMDMLFAKMMAKFEEGNASTVLQMRESED